MRMRTAQSRVRAVCGCCRRPAKHLGTIIAPKHVHNMAWGDDDGRTLCLCGRSGLYRMRLNIPGIRP